MKKEEFVEFIKWAHKSDENKKKAVDFIQGLEKYVKGDESFSEKDLEKISGGMCQHQFGLGTFHS
jgi:hypothetical protein